MGVATTTTPIYQKNEFLGNVVEKIGRQQYSSRAYQNPLARFKKGFIANANEIEEIYVARINGATQDLEGVDTLKRTKPSVTTQYHKQNYAKVYTATVTDQQIRRAFTTDGGVKRMSDEILTQLQSGYEYDEYIAMRNNCVDLFTNTPTTAKKTITALTDNATAKAFVKQIKKDISDMKFRSTKYATVERNCKASDLVLIIRSGLMAEIDVELLATAFNKSVVDLKETTIIEVDDFPGQAKLQAMLIEESALMVFDTLYNIEPQRNAKGMFTNHHLNVEKIISTSNMYNCAMYSIV